MTIKQYREKYGPPYGPQLEVGELYWALPALDPDDDTGYGNIAQPARFMGFNESGEDLWMWLGAEVEDWPARWVGDLIPMPGGMPGDNPPVR